MADPADPRSAQAAPNPGFFATIGIALRALGGSLGSCIALSVPPALLVGAAAGLLHPLAEVDGAPGSVAGVLATGVVTTAAMGTMALALAVVLPLSAAGLAWVGMRAASGGQAGASEALEKVLERGPQAVGAFLLTMLAVLAAPALLGLLAVVVGVVAGEVAAGILSLLVLASLVWPAFVYWVRFSLAVPAAVADDASAATALGRSADRVRGGFWWVLGILALTALGAAVVGSILQGAFSVAEEGPAAAVGTAVGQSLSLMVSLAVGGVTTGVVYAVRGIPEPEPEPAGVVEGPDGPSSGADEWPGPGSDEWPGPGI